jgi:arylsulfatase A-like enzyme
MSAGTSHNSNRAARYVLALPKRRLRWPVFAALALLLACTGEVHPPQHLVLITIDTLRRDRVSTYGYHRKTTPNLDRLAERGVRADDAIAQSTMTPPSHASMLTGLRPPSHGLRRIFGQRLRADNVTLAEILSQAGFHTAAFVSGLTLRRSVGLDQGFDVYEDSFSATERERIAGDTNHEIRTWLEGRPPGRCFLWVHYFDPHSSYLAPAEFRERFGAPDVSPSDLHGPVNANPETGSPSETPVPAATLAMMSNLYDAEIAYTDAAVGELLDMLQHSGLLAKAIVVVAADHGESLGERGYYFGHWDVFDETARIPLILAHPDGSWAGSRLTELISSIDIMPTALAWLGLEPPPGIEGRDLTPLLEGDELEVQPAYTERRRFFIARAVRDQRWLLVERRASKSQPEQARLSLYDRQTGRVADGAPGASEAKERLAGLLKRMATPPSGRQSEEISVPQDVADELRALGYVDE